MGFLLNSNTLPEPEVDQILCAATHEAGHAVAFKAAGVRVRKLEVWAPKSHAHSAHGICDVDESQIPDMGAFLLGILAGDVAECRWLMRYHGHTSHTARRELASGSASDLAKFHEHSAGKFREAKVRRKAESFVWWNWGRIERLGKKLARKRSLRGSAV